jgi:hypothetical protein
MKESFSSTHSTQVCGLLANWGVGVFSVAGDFWFLRYSLFAYEWLLWKPRRVAF